MPELINILLSINTVVKIRLVLIVLLCYLKKKLLLFCFLGGGGGGEFLCNILKDKSTNGTKRCLYIMSKIWLYLAGFCLT